MPDIIHFSHANSFPAPVYGKLLRALGQHYQLGWLDCIGHDPQYPVTDCWPHLVAETIACLHSRYQQPVIGVGHSLGGYLLFYAAIRAPELFKGLVILDSPLMGPRRAGFIWLAKKLGLIDRITPGGNTLGRRDSWASVEMMHDYFARKPAFARFDPDCLADYALHGSEDDGHGGRRLRFRPRIEHQIYCGLPHDFPRYRGQLTVPTAFVAASRHDVVRPSDLRYMQRYFGMQLHEVGGSHLFPLEQPLATAQTILQLLPDLLHKAQ
jgi:pimeloyl-ACP methyl ester carboxylesterase